MKPDLPKSCDNPKLLTGDIERLLKFLSYFPADGQPSLSSPACGGEANAFNQRALKLYAEMHFREEGVPEPPIIPESSGGPEDLYAMVRWCITVWPIWKRVSGGESRAPQRPAEPERPTAEGTRTPMDATGVPDEALLSPATMAKVFGVDCQALRKRLERLRKKDHNCFIENEDRKATEAQYLYKVGAARPIIAQLKASSSTASKRPAQE